MSQRDQLVTRQQQVQQARDTASQNATLARTRWVDAKGNPTDNPSQAAQSKDPTTGQTGPTINPLFNPTLADSYQKEADSYNTQLNDLTNQIDAIDKQTQPQTSVHPDANGGLVAVTTQINPNDSSQKITSTDVTPNGGRVQIANIPGVGVMAVDPKTQQAQMIWTQQGLTPDQRTTALYQGYSAYANYLDAQTRSGTMQEAQRKDLWDEAHQQYADQMGLIKTQMDAANQDNTVRNDEANYDSKNLATATQFGNDMANADINSMKYMAGPSMGADFAANFQRIGANPAGGLANIQFQPNDFNFTAPDPVSLAQNATASLLAHVSPYAQLQLPSGNASSIAAGATSVPTPQIPQPPVATAVPPSPDAIGQGMIDAGNGATPGVALPNYGPANVTMAAGPQAVQGNLLTP